MENNEVPKTPEIIIPSGTKPLSDKAFRKRPTEEMPDFGVMTEEQLIDAIIELIESHSKPPQSNILYPIVNREKELKRQQGILNRLTMLLAFMRIAEYKDKHK